MRLFVGKLRVSALSAALLAVLLGGGVQAQAPFDLPARMQDPNQWVMAANEPMNAMGKNV